jgi:hypothetical protein
VGGERSAIARNLRTRLRTCQLTGQTGGFSLSATEIPRFVNYPFHGSWLAKLPEKLTGWATAFLSGDRFPVQLVPPCLRRTLLRDATRYGPEQLNSQNASGLQSTPIPLILSSASTWSASTWGVCVRLRTWIGIGGNLKSLELGPQAFAADAKNLGGAGAVSARVLQHREDQLLFHFLQRHGSDSRRWR